MLQNDLLFVILQQKILSKSDDAVDIQNIQGEARSCDMQGHEVCVPTAFSVKTKPGVGPVSVSFCNSCSSMCHVFFIVHVIHSKK